MTAYSNPPLSPTAVTDGGRTDLEHVLHSYVFCARAEGKSPKTIDIGITSVLALVDFLRAGGHSTSLHDIGLDELRRFIVHLLVPFHLPDFGQHSPLKRIGTGFQSRYVRIAPRRSLA